MKTIHCILLIVILLLSSCRKEINIDLNSADPKVVIIAQLREGTKDFKVTITETSNYFDNNASNTINNAVVSVFNGQGIETILTAEGNGVYKATNYTALANQKYTLKVIAKGKTYTAESFMHTLVPIDSLPYAVAQGFASFGNDTSYTVSIQVNDPVNIKNAYRAVVTLNDTVLNKAEDIYNFDDKFTDGNTINIPYFRKTFILNDTVNIELLCIDYVSFKYWETLSGIVNDSGGGSNAAPANPITNIKGGALGYFEASSSSNKTLIIK